MHWCWVGSHTMAGRAKGKEVALQIEVDAQEDWEEVIGKEGLTGKSYRL